MCRYISLVNKVPDSYFHIAYCWNLCWTVRSQITSSFSVSECNFYYGQLVILFRSKWNSLRSNFDRTVNLFHALSQSLEYRPCIFHPPSSSRILIFVITIVGSGYSIQRTRCERCIAEGVRHSWRCIIAEGETAEDGMSSVYSWAMLGNIGETAPGDIGYNADATNVCADHNEVGLARTRVAQITNTKQFYLFFTFIYNMHSFAIKFKIWF